MHILNIIIILLLLESSVSQATVCQSINAKNNVKYLKELENCTVVEGFVQIVLIEGKSGVPNSETDFSNISFPLLREITQYLMLYRVKGLRSIGHLFPNLEKIGGDALFEDYALIVVDMWNLQEVGLKSLKEISRGSVIFFKNRELCYLNTIKWEIITKWGVTLNYMSDNKATEECPQCQGCPEDRCWDNNVCQIREPIRKDCHELCVGDCSDPGPRGCYSCKGVLDLEGNCVKSCPPNTFAYLNRRCVSRENCNAMSVSTRGKTTTNISHYVIYEDKCLEKCPSGFTSDGKNGACYPCLGGQCRTTCTGAKITTIASAQRLKGCTRILGSINLSIITNDSLTFYKELEENLGSIEEIEGYLKITRASVTNLNFFKNLSIIHGKTDKNTSVTYSMYIVDNSNLQELWNWTAKQNLTVLSGRLFFHYNPKLCFNQIQQLMEIIHYEKNFSKYEISKESNGDKFPCDSTKIEMTIYFKSFDRIDIHMPYIDQNSSTPVLLRYVLYYRKDQKNIKMFDDLDECSGNAWITKDFTIDPDDQLIKHHGFFMNLTDLKPDTKYVFYVTTYNISRVIAKSKFHYVKTLPKTPSELAWFHAFSNSSSEIVLEWSPPKRVNGKLQEYIVTWTILEVENPLAKERDYCKNPMFPSLVENQMLSKQQTKKVKEGCCNSDLMEKEDYGHLCSRSGNAKSLLGHNEKQKFLSCESIFNHYIQRNFSKTMPKNKYMSKYIRKSPNSLYYGNNHLKIKSPFTNHEAKPSVIHHPANSQGLTIKSLKHFTDYLVTVKACREKDPEELNLSEDFRCSKTEIMIVRTAKDIYADNISKTVVKSVNQGTLKLKWSPPENPNGFILGFVIEYKRRDDDISKKTHCVTYSQFLESNMKYTISGIPNGKYVFRLRSISLAGYGDFTDFIPFDVFESKMSIIEMIACVLVQFMIVLIIFLSYYICKFKYYKSYSIVLAEVNPNYNHLLDPYEIDRSDIEFCEELGVGTFGKVFKGLLKPDNTQCAIKIVNEDLFFSEVATMKSMTTAYHVVKLLGVVTKGQPPLVIMELMELGDLKSYLRSLRESYPLTNGVMIKMALEIADAMTFMEAHKFIHRDLAARNCMINIDLTIKVGDFGMARDIYETDYYRKSNKGLLPIRWMAPESLKDGEFSSQSDIWSFGIVLWEIVTMAEQPYQGSSNEEVLHDVIGGRTLDIPKNCPLVLKSLMNCCWRKKPSSRTSFMHILTSMEYYHDEEFKSVSYYYSSEAILLRKCVWEYVDMKPVDPLLPNENQSKLNTEIVRTYSVLPSRSSRLYLPKKETFTIIEEEETL